MFTNIFWSDFGKADEEQKRRFTSMNAEQKKQRKTWLQEMHGTQMPCGPYPFYLRDYGWCQVTLPKDGPVAARYFRRGDSNLDVNFFADADGMPAGTGAQKMVAEKTKIQNVEILQEMYDPKANAFISKPIGPISLSGK